MQDAAVAQEIQATPPPQVEPDGTEGNNATESSAGQPAGLSAARPESTTPNPANNATESPSGQNGQSAHAERQAGSDSNPHPSQQATPEEMRIKEWQKAAKAALDLLNDLSAKERAGTLTDPERQQLEALRALPRALLESLAGVLPEGAIKAREAKIATKLLAEGKITEKQAQRQEQFLARVQEKIQKQMTEVKNLLQKNQINGKTLSERVLAYDMEYALIGKEAKAIEAQRQQYVDYLAQMSTDRYAVAKINAKIQVLESQLKATQKRQEEIKEAREKAINKAREDYSQDPSKAEAVPDNIEKNQLVTAVTVFADKLALAKTGAHLTQERVEEIAKDPLGYLQEEVMRAAGSSQESDRKELAIALGITEEKEIENFCRDILDLKTLENQLKTEDMRKTLKDTLIALGAIGLLFAYIARKREGAGGGQQGMMG